MPTVETLPRFDRDWKGLSPQQRDTFRKVVKEAFVPDLTAPDRPFRPGLRVKGVKAHPNVSAMTWDGDGRATFSYGNEREPGQPHIIWRRIGSHGIFSPPPARNPLATTAQPSRRYPQHPPGKLGVLRATPRLIHSLRDTY